MIKLMNGYEKYSENLKYTRILVLYGTNTQAFNLEKKV